MSGAAARRAGLALVWGGAAWTLAAFFLPWAHFTLPQADLAQLLSEKLGGRVTIELEAPHGRVGTDLSALTAIPAQLSGAELPAFFAQERVRVALALAEMWQAGLQQWAGRANWVYAVPGLALLLAGLLTFGPRRAGLGWLAAAILAGAAAWATWQWSTINWGASTGTVVPGVGLWSSGLAYLIMAAGAALLASLGRAQRA